MFGYPYLSEFGEAGLTFRSGDDALRLGGVKIIVTESTGTVFPEAPALAEMVRQSERAGFPVAIHAIQARSVLAVIAALEKTAKPELRHRIEHCLECPPEIMERLRQLKPIVVTQPAFLYYGGDRTLATQPEQSRFWFYRFRSLNDILTLAGSSDSPVSGDHPMTGIYAAVTRKTQTGGIINAAEALSAFTGLKMYTTNAAYASGDENSKGSITPGKLADLVVLDANPLTVPAAAIKDINVLMTIVAGQVVWEG
jgi:predicted amidohydrolase YtcJ